MAKTIKLSKIFVLDTNVILHDSDCLKNFQDNDIVIPIAVLEELDKFKKGREQINFNARNFARVIDELANGTSIKSGISLGKNRGRLFVELGHPYTDAMQVSLIEDIPDHRILAVTAFVAQKNPDRYVALVTKDINLRLKAKSLDLHAEDYKTDKVEHMERLDAASSAKTLKVSDSLIARVYQDGHISAKELKIKAEANEYHVLQGENSSVLVVYNDTSQRFVRIEKQRCFGIEARNSEQTFALDALMNPEIQLVSLTGIAGTGKTLLAVATALQLSGEFEQIMLARPVIPLQNQEIGFLPGDAKEKIGPYMLPLFDNINFIKSRFKATSREVIAIDEMIRNEKLLISPLAYIRGRTLSNTFVIIDEAQNLTPHEVKTIITRAGENTKIVLTGDIFQIDSPYLDKQSNGITYLTDRMRGQAIFAHVNLVKGERSLLAEIAGKRL